MVASQKKTLPLRLGILYCLSSVSHFVLACTQTLWHYYFTFSPLNSNDPKKKERCCLLDVFWRREWICHIFFPAHLMLVSDNKSCHYWDTSSTKLLFRKIKIKMSMTFFLPTEKQMMMNKGWCETKTDASNHPNSIYIISTLRVLLCFLVLVQITEVLCRIKTYLSDIIWPLY